MATATPAPAASTALARVEMPAWASEVLKPYEQDARFELLMPAIPMSAQLGKGMMPSLSMVRVSADPQDGDVYKVGSRKAGDGWQDVFAYAKPALERLAGAAGIQIRTRRTDDRKDHNFCEFEAVGAMRNESGEIVMRSATAGVHFPSYAEDRWTEILSANEKSKPQYKKPEGELRAAWTNEMAQYRKHFIRRVDTKATLAVIRMLLAIKSQLTAEQVAKPKVVLRIALDTRDPVVQGALMAQGISASALLYGPSREAPESRAEVVDNGHALTPGALPEAEAEPLGPAGPAPEPSTDPRKRFTEACEGFGLTFVEAAEILTAHGNDYAKAAAEIERRANEKE